MAVTKACSEELHIENASAVLTKLTTLFSTSLPNTTRATVDDTTQADNCVEKLGPGLLSLGTITATFKGEVGDADFVILEEMDAAGDIRPGKIVVGNTGNRKEYAISAFITSLNRGDEAAPGENRTVVAEFQLRALPTLADPV